MSDIIKTAGVLILKDDKVLLVEHTKAADHETSKFGLPAGRIKADETPAQAAVRELQEETGLTTEIAKLQLLSEIYQAKILHNNHLKQFEMYVFVCTFFTGELANISETKPQWVNLKDVGTLNLLPNIPDIINKGRRMLEK